MDPGYYGGTHGSGFWHADVLQRYGRPLLPPNGPRGVLLDIAGLKGSKMLAGGPQIHVSDIKAAAKRQGIELRRGDVVIFNTGWQELATADPTKFLESEPGLDVDGAEYLARLGVVAVGADTWGLDVLPNPDPDLLFPVHQILLAKNGPSVLMRTRVVLCASRFITQKYLSIPHLHTNA